MRTQSNTYEPFADVRQCDIAAQFGVFDLNARENASIAEYSPEEEVSQINQVLIEDNTISGRYITLEPNEWVLDGSYSLFGDDIAALNTGFWSDGLSDQDGDFAIPPYIKFYFAGLPVSTAGLTLLFDGATNNYASAIRIISYGSDLTTVIDDMTFENTEIEAVLPFASQKYYALKVEFLATNLPDRRIRLSRIIFGVIKKYSAGNVVKLSLVRSAGFAASSLPYAEMRLTVDNASREYDLLAPQNIYAFLQDGQPLSVNININGEAVYMGDFYYKSAKALDNGLTAEITATDRVRALDLQVFNQGRSAVVTLQQAVGEILAGTDITAVFDGSLGNTNVNMAIPQNTNKREALRLLAQAACCSCWINRDGLLLFKDLVIAATPAQTLTGDELESYNGISVSDKIDAVSLNVNNSFTQTQQVFTAGVGINQKSVNNPCVHNGQTVADWLLACYNRRRRYSVNNRCDPALEVGDTVRIYDAYGQNLNTVQTGYSITYNGGLTAKTDAVGA